MSATGRNVYTDGSYLEETGGTWHEEDAPFKARWILKMLRRHANERCRFVLGEAFGDGVTHALVLVTDVVEHVEDSFGFLRQTRERKRKPYYIPLDVHVLGVTNTWEVYGHIHR